MRPTAAGDPGPPADWASQTGVIAGRPARATEAATTTRSTCGSRSRATSANRPSPPTPPGASVGDSERREGGRPRGKWVTGRAVLLAVTAGALTSAPAHALGCEGTAGPARVGRPAPWRAWRARLEAPSPVYARPGARQTGRVGPAAADALLVLDAREQGGRCWVRVRLPSRPDTAAGWVNAERVQLASTPWRIAVHTGSRRLEMLKSGRLVRRMPVVVGAPSTPTPRGLFAIAGIWRWRRDDFLGSWVLTLTAHSDVLQRFDGGDGRVALHGRGGASLLDPLGTAASHGCVRLANAAISWLVRTIGRARSPGTPVAID